MFAEESWSGNKTADELSSRLFSGTHGKRQLEGKGGDSASPVKSSKINPSQNINKRKNDSTGDGTSQNFSAKKKKEANRNPHNETSMNGKKHKTGENVKSQRNKYKHLAVKRNETVESDVSNSNKNSQIKPSNKISLSNEAPNKHYKFEDDSEKINAKKSKAKKKGFGNDQSKKEGVKKTKRKSLEKLKTKKDVTENVSPEKAKTKSPKAKKVKKIKVSDSESLQKNEQGSTEKIKLKDGKPKKVKKIQDGLVSTTDKEDEDPKTKKNKGIVSSPKKGEKRKRKRKKKNNPKKNKYRHLVQAKPEESSSGDKHVKPSKMEISESKEESMPVGSKSKSKKTVKGDSNNLKENPAKTKFVEISNQKTPEKEGKSSKRSKPELSLKDRMSAKLNSARFRYLNEQLYTQTGKESLHLFRDDLEAFQVYHNGFQSQVEKWPSHPLDSIIKYVQTRSPDLVLADFGCGDAKLAQSVPNKVHSFDLVSLNDHVVACDMSKVPLKSDSVDVCVFCLSLMGTNLMDYLAEANRVLKIGVQSQSADILAIAEDVGILKIAEVNSRFHALGSFTSGMNKLGFSLLHQNTSNKMFVLLDFKKTSLPKGTKPDISLLPCIYKKR